LNFQNLFLIFLTYRRKGINHGDRASDRGAEKDEVRQGHGAQAGRRGPAQAADGVTGGQLFWVVTRPGAPP
jgi:hypothetical protein